MFPLVVFLFYCLIGLVGVAIFWGAQILSGEISKWDADHTIARFFRRKHSNDEHLRRSLTIQITSAKGQPSGNELGVLLDSLREQKRELITAKAILFEARATGKGPTGGKILERILKEQKKQLLEEDTAYVRFVERLEFEGLGEEKESTRTRRVATDLEKLEEDAAPGLVN